MSEIQVSDLLSSVEFYLSAVEKHHGISALSHWISADTILQTVGYWARRGVVLTEEEKDRHEALFNRAIAARPAVLNPWLKLQFTLNKRTSTAVEYQEAVTLAQNAALQAQEGENKS